MSASRVRLDEEEEETVGWRREAATLDELKRQVKELRERYPHLEDDQLFVVWFLRARVNEDINRALSSLPDRSKDKNADAVYVFDEGRTVYVLQGKFHVSEQQKLEPANDLRGFAQLGEQIAGDRDGFVALVEGLSPSGRAKLTAAREKVLRGRYGLTMFYVTTGKASPDLVREITNRVRNVQLKDKQRARFEFHDRAKVLAYLERWLDGVAPPPSDIELPMPDGHLKHFQRVSGKLGITLWVFTLTGDEIAKVYRERGPRIFAANIRGFLGEAKKSINAEIKETVAKAPRDFLYSNNGVTLVCDDARSEGEGEDEFLHVSGPQIINGQQTTRVLAASPGLSRRARILVRVISLPRELQDSGVDRDNLIASIVRATNRQNAISAADLKSNDRRQVWLEQRLGLIDYQYLRKKQTKGEAKAIGIQAHWQIKKTEMAKAVAACETSDLGVAGIDPLFEYYYDTLFKSTDPWYYLSCYWLTDTVRAVARGDSQRSWGRWSLIHHMWVDAGAIIRHNRKRFVGQRERLAKSDIAGDPLRQWADAGLRAAVRFYQLNAGKGVARMDAATFFKPKDVYKRFAAFLESDEGKPQRRRYDKTRERFLSSLASDD
jgi:hypothetical protein